jgi:hypothetical protein
LLATPHILEIRTIQITINNTKAIIVGIKSLQNFSLVLSFIDMSVFISGFLSHNSLSESFLGRKTIFLVIFLNQSSIIVDQLKVAMALFQSITIFEYSQVK